MASSNFNHDSKCFSLVGQGELSDGIEFDVELTWMMN